VVLAFILNGAFLSHQEANRRAALTPEQRAAEDKQQAEEARIAAARQAEVDKQKAAEDKIAAARQAEAESNRNKDAQASPTGRADDGAKQQKDSDKPGLLGTTFGFTSRPRRVCASAKARTTSPNPASPTTKTSSSMNLSFGAQKFLRVPNG
jgi:hypothetical protein